MVLLRYMSVFVTCPCFSEMKMSISEKSDHSQKNLIFKCLDVLAYENTTQHLNLGVFV